jgi:hypothetical protein
VFVILVSLAHAQSNRDVHLHADHAFQADSAASRLSVPGEKTGPYSPDHYWIGSGQGDLTKGKLVCRRVSELSARTDLAKQIRVLVKERMVDRLHERSGRETEQDIELIREELVQEYLQGVKIVEYHVDEANQICTAIAVMPKSALLPRNGPPEDPSPAASH